jgi:FkbM family methyltransferase
MSIRTIKNSIRNKVWLFLKANWQLLSGLRIVVKDDSDWFVYNEIFVNKEYDEALKILFSNLPENPLVLDLGANVGYFTLKMADELMQAGCNKFRIIAVEGTPQNHAVLRQRINQPLLHDKVSAFCGLAGYKTGAHTVRYSSQHYGHSSASAKSEDKYASTVSYLDIEKLLPENVEKINFLKCDIEGSEEIFINEYPELLKRVEIAVFEFHSQECNVAYCKEMLQNAGLRSMGTIKTDASFHTSVEIFGRH